MRKASNWFTGIFAVATLMPALAFAAGADDAAAPAGFDKPREVPHGQVKPETYQSKSLDAERKLVVYLPPGYDKSKKYPVLYLLHGSGDDETGWTQKGSENVILDNLYADGKAEPMIVVMPNGFARAPGQPATREPTPEQRRDGAARFEKDLLGDVIPFIESHYPAIADANHRALAGLSMGGGQTLRIGPPHSDIFAYLGVFSAGLRRPRDGSAPNVDAFFADYPDAKTLNSRLKLFWISCGDHDPGLEGAKLADKALTDRKVEHVWHEDSGAHEWPVWKNDLYLVAQRLFKNAG